MDNDNTKRTIIAVALCTLVIVGWGYLFPPQQAPQQAPQAQQTEQAGQAASQPMAAIPEAAAPVAAPSFTPSAGEEVVVNTPLYRATFNSAGGILTSFELKNYKQTIEPGSPLVNLLDPKAMAVAPMGLLWEGQGTWRTGSQWAAPSATNLSIELGQDGEVTFSGMFGGLHFTRTLHFTADNYTIDETLALANTSATPVSGRLGFNMASVPMSSQDDRYNLTRISWLDAEGVDKQDDVDDLKQAELKNAPNDVLSNGIKWGAIQSSYFTLAVAPEAESMGLKGKFENDLYRMVMDVNSVAVSPGTKRELKTTYYFGPIQSEHLDMAPSGLNQLVTYGFFDVISKPLMMGLKFLQSYVGNWGVAIILLTIGIKIVFWPLSQKSYKSMNKMKKIQPLMAKVREQYKDDRTKMNQEMMQLYKTYKVNPAGGCLPMLLQIPVFFGLYQALLGAIELRHAAFISHVPFTDIIWLADLSTKDPYYVTPLIMGATMFLQQKMTPAPGDPTQAKMMMFMPLLFTFMFLNFPSGLVVYWLVNNVLSIAQQWWLLRKA